MLNSLIDLLNPFAANVMAHLANSAAISFIAILIAVIAARHRSWSAASRYALWWVLVAFLIAMPIISAFLPVAHPVTVPTPLSYHSFHALAQPAARHFSLSAILLLVWCLSSAIQLLFLMHGLISGKLLKRASVAAPESLGACLATLARKAGIRRPISVLATNKLAVPAMVGYVRPSILIPDDLAQQLNPTELEQVLLHELAHAARRDDWAILVQRLIETLAPWHPLLRYLSYRLSRDREIACDDFVSAFHEPKQYATCLAKVANISPLSTGSAVLVPLLERKSELLSRVEMLLDKTRAHATTISSRRLVIATIASIVLATVGLQSPKLMALQAPTVPIYSIIVTDDNGGGAMFGNWSADNPGDGGRQHGTIEYKANGKLYIIRDKSTVDQAVETVKPSEARSKLQAELAEQLEKSNDQLSQVEEDGRSADRQLSAVEAEQLNQQLQQLEAQVTQLKATSSQSKLNQAQENLAKLQAYLSKMQADMEAASVAEGGQQAQISELQAKLRLDQAEQSRHQAIESKRILDQLQKLIREAESRGLSQPLP